MDYTFIVLYTRKKLMKNNVLIIVPAYNEEDNIKETISRIAYYCPQLDYIVINDGSKDNTLKECYNNSINVLNIPINMGLSAAFRTGMKYAYANNYDYVIQIDADGQHRCEYILDIYQYSLKNHSDITIGSRYISPSKDKHSLRMIGNKLISLCIRLTTGKKIYDCTSGMRLYNRRMIQLFAKNNNLYPEPDTIAYLIRCGAKVNEYPVVMDERMHGSSYLNIWKSIRYMFEICTSVLIMQWFRRKKGLL